MKPVLGMLAMFALLSGTAFAAHPSSFNIFYYIVVIPLVILALVFLPAIIFFLFRNSKEGSFAKRLANFMVPMAIFFGTVLILFIIAVLILFNSSIKIMNWDNTNICAICILANIPFALVFTAYIWMKYSSKILNFLTSSKPKKS
jgi:4-amino-4-deoxy-L-arabinose transferase-like glycosyltransferase